MGINKATKNSNSNNDNNSSSNSNKNSSDSEKNSKKAGVNFFHGLLSGKFKTVKDKQGYIFIDRDSKCFEYILKCLRAGSVELSVNKNSTFYKELQTEIDFYQYYQLK